MNHPLQINAQNFEAEVLQSETPVVVDFWAPACSVCQLMEPIVHRMANVFHGQVKITLCNAAEAPELAAQYHVMASPTFIFFKNGQAVDSLVGYHDEAHFTAHLEKVLAA